MKRAEQPSLATYARAVKRARTEVGWSTRKLAQVSGVSVASINQFENGRNINLTNALAILKALSMEWSDVTDDCQHEYTCKWCGEPNAMTTHVPDVGEQVSKR